MDLIKVILRSLFFSLLIAAGAFAAIFIVTYGLLESIIPAIVGAAIGFIWSYSYFLASSDYKLSQRYENLSYAVSNLENRKEQLNNDVCTQEAHLRQIKKEENAAAEEAWRKKEEKYTDQINRIFDEKKQHFPWLVKQLADLQYKVDSEIADGLRNKIRPAYKSAEIVEKIAEEKRVLFQLSKQYEYQLAFYESKFPWLLQFKEIPPAEAMAFTGFMNEDEKGLSNTQTQSDSSTDRIRNNSLDKASIGKETEEAIIRLEEIELKIKNAQARYRNKQSEHHAILAEKERQSWLKIREEEKKCVDQIHKLFAEKKQDYPWLAQQLADLQYAVDSEISNDLRFKSRPAYKAAEAVAKLSAEKRELFQMAKRYEYQLAFYESMFPWLEEFKEIPPATAVKITDDVSEEASEYESMRSWLSPDEYANLSNVEKYQIALDRYRQREKSQWEIGRDFERYIGYMYEEKGYKVEYYGAIKHLEDMGRDLIIERENETTLIVQCKRWAKEKTIHEKHIFQLFGTVTLLSVQHPEKTYKGVFVCTCQLSDLARKCADALNIDVLEEQPVGEYPLVKCNIGSHNGEKIYHLPFDQQYDRIRIEKDRGEMYAFTVAEAEEKGFRRAFRWLGKGE